MTQEERINYYQDKKLSEWRDDWPLLKSTDGIGEFSSDQSVSGCLYFLSSRHSVCIVDDISDDNHYLIKQTLFGGFSALVYREYIDAIDNELIERVKDLIHSSIVSSAIRDENGTNHYIEDWTWGIELYNFLRFKQWLHILQIRQHPLFEYVNEVENEIVGIIDLYLDSDKEIRPNLSDDLILLHGDDKLFLDEELPYIVKQFIKHIVIDYIKDLIYDPDPCSKGNVIKEGSKFNSIEFNIQSIDIYMPDYTHIYVDAFERGYTHFSAENSSNYEYASLLENDKYDFISVKLIELELLQLNKWKDRCKNLSADTLTLITQFYQGYISYIFNRIKGADCKEQASSIISDSATNSIIDGKIKIESKLLDREQKMQLIKIINKHFENATRTDEDWCYVYLALEAAGQYDNAQTFQQDMADCGLKVPAKAAFSRCRSYFNADQIHANDWKLLWKAVNTDKHSKLLAKIKRIVETTNQAYELLTPVNNCI